MEWAAERSGAPFSQPPPAHRPPTTGSMSDTGRVESRAQQAPATTSSPRNLAVSGASRFHAGAALASMVLVLNLLALGIISLPAWIG
jgi:hypothetical protein